MKKRMFRKWLCIWMTVVLATAFLTSCQKKEEFVPDEKTRYLRLALREGIYADVIKECLSDFQKENNVYCEVYELSEDDLHSFVVDDAAKVDGTYDLCMVDGSWMAEYTDKGVLASLSGLGFKLDDDIIPATTKVCYHNDEVYLAPYYGNVTVLLYNKLLVMAAGYEPEEIQSLDVMLEICQKVSKKGNLGFMYRGDTTNDYVVDFLPILLSFGGWVVDEKNQPTVDTPEFNKAMNFYLDLIATGNAETKDNLIMALANNAAVMAIGWPGWYTPSKKSTADYIALTGKESANATAYNANVYGIWTLGITANSQNQELAVKLLSYLMDPDVQKSTVAHGGVPCRYSSLQDEEVLEKFPQYEAVCKALESGIYRPIMVEWPEFYEILGTEMKQIINGNKLVSQGLADAQRQLENLMDNDMLE